MIEIRTGSDSDILKMKDAYDYLEEHQIEYSPRILSAHRTPSAMVEAAQNLSEDGFRVSVCAAGGAAHLPGMTASETLVPVVGLPIMLVLYKDWTHFYLLCKCQTVYQLEPWGQVNQKLRWN